MGAGHSHPLYIHEHSPFHRLAPEAKLVGALSLVTCIAVTPRHAVWAFGIYGLVVVTCLLVARIPMKFFAARLVAIAPFVVFALFIPLIAGGPTTQFLGLEVSIEGLWGAWNILVKAALGASVTIVLTATTEIPDLIRGLGDLRVPALFISIAMFMVRYLELVADEVKRMRVAMTARGYDPRWLAQARPIATGAGAMFVRTYERGERIHAAMLARGFTETMPRLDHRRATSTEWVSVVLFALMCAAVASLALVAT